jgi:D-glycero-alpha-D-manno-heptose-7-phosphate kinase
MEDIFVGRVRVGGYQGARLHGADHRKRAVRARAPLRLGLAGDGTDLPSYSEAFGGAVLNATIDRYAFASIQPRDDGCLVFDACDIGHKETHAATSAVPGSRLLLHRGVYEHMVHKYNKNQPLTITITTVVDAPMGSGLGSSSALVVALIEAYCAYLDVQLDRLELAHLAHQIERIDLGLAGGQQDQFSATFGGINFIEFLQGGRVIVNPLRFRQPVINELESSLVVCFSGPSRMPDRIIRHQSERLDARSAETLEAMHGLKEDASEMKIAVLLGDMERFAAVLERSWLAKKHTAPDISNPIIEELEALGRRNGAVAAKVSGAGGGGFMMFVVPPEQRYRLITALNDAGNPAYPVKLTECGSEAWTIPARD